MAENQNLMNKDGARSAGLPEPHRCPWLVQYMLISPLRKIMEPVQQLVGPYVKPGMTVLDPGCGFGYVSLPLARMVSPNGRVIAVDVEPRAVARLQRRARQAGLAERIVAQTCTSVDLGLAAYSGQVDLVTVIHALHEFPDIQGFLTQVTALLKPTGHLLIVEPQGHVTPAHFEAELQCCRRAGFDELNRPTLGRRNMAALLAPTLD